MPTNKKPQKPQVDDAKLFARQSAGQNENFISRKGQMNFAPPFQIRLFKWKVFNLDPNRTHVTKLANKFQVLPNLLLCAFRMQWNARDCWSAGWKGRLQKKGGNLFNSAERKRNELSWTGVKAGLHFLMTEGRKIFSKAFQFGPAIRVIEICICVERVGENKT